MGRSRSTDFAELHGELVPPQPGRSPRVRQLSYLFKADHRKLQKVLDQWLNRPSNYELRFTPLIPYVIVSFSTTLRGFSVPRHEEGFGITTYQEQVITLFIQQKTGCLFTNKIYTFLPYLFLDSAGPMAAGRELFGLPKNFGELAIDEEHGNCHVWTRPPSDHPNPRMNSTKREILRITNLKHPQVEPSRQADFTELGVEIFNYEQAQKNVAKSISGSSWAEAKLISSLYLQSPQMKFVNLRQVRDYQDKRKAVYQSIFEYAANNITYYNSRIVPGEFELSFPDKMEMYPMWKQFGIKGKALSCFFLDWGFNFTPGPEIWNSRNGKKR